MAVTAARLQALVTADTSQGEAGLKKFGGQVTETAATTQRETGGMGQSFKNLGSAVAPVLGAIAASRAVDGVVDFTQESIMAASDAAESQNKMQVVFGASADSIESFAQSAATNLGMSTQQATEAAATFGNLFTSMGMGQAEAAGLSKSLVQLAVDEASLNNLPVDVMLEKLRSGMVGEAEPLRAVGILLSAASVSSKALEMGLGDANDVVSEAGLLQARYALMVSQSSSAQGDFARTSDGLAGSLKIADAHVADLKVQLGELTIKPYTAVLSFAVTGLGNVASLLQRTSNDSGEQLTGLRAQLAATEKEIAGMGSASGKGILGGLFDQKFSPEQIEKAKAGLEDIKAQIAYLETSSAPTGDVGATGFQQKTSAVQELGSAAAETTQKLDTMAQAATDAKTATAGTSQGGPFGQQFMDSLTDSIATGDAKKTKPSASFWNEMLDQTFDPQALKKAITGSGIGQKFMDEFSASVLGAASGGDKKEKAGLGAALVPVMLKSIDAQLVADASKLTDKGAKAYDKIEAGFIAQAQNSTAFIAAVNAMVDNSLARYAGAE